MAKIYGTKKCERKSCTNDAPPDKVGGHFLCEACRRDLVTVFKNQTDEWCKNLAAKKITTQAPKIILPPGYKRDK